MEKQPGEIISIESEEGQMLKNSFGGIAAVLRFKLAGSN
jgi:peptide subunit release factor 1 (eRF1)